MTISAVTVTMTSLSQLSRLAPDLTSHSHTIKGILYPTSLSKRIILEFAGNGFGHGAIGYSRSTDDEIRHVRKLAAFCV